MGRMVVDHDVDVELLRHRLVDELKELLELDGPVLRCELMSDLSGGQIEGGVEVDRPVALVVVTLALRNARQHREDRLGAIECLHLGLLVDAENNGMIGWEHVEPDDVSDLVDEERVRRVVATA